MVLKLFLLEADILGISKEGSHPRKLIQLSPTTPCNGLLFEANISKCVVDPAEDSFSNENGKVFLIKNTYLKSKNRIALLMQTIRACATRRARAIIVQVTRNPPTSWTIGDFVEAVLTLGESNSPNMKWIQFLGLCPELQELSHLRIPVCFMMEIPFDLLVSNPASYIQARPSETYIDGKKYDPPPLSRLLGDILSSNLPLLDIERKFDEVLLGSEYIGDWSHCQDALNHHCNKFNFPFMYSLSMRLGRKEGRNTSTSMHRAWALKYVYEFSFTASALEMMRWPSIENDCRDLEQELVKMLTNRDTSSDRRLSLFFFLRCSSSARAFQLPSWENLLNSMLSVEGVPNMITKVDRAREKLSQQLPTAFSPQDEVIALSVFTRSIEEIKHLQRLLLLSWSSPHRDQIHPLVEELVSREVKRMASRGASHLYDGWCDCSIVFVGSDPILSPTAITDIFRKEILRGSSKLFMDCIRHSRLSALLLFPDAMAHISEGKVDLVNAIDALDLFLERSAEDVHETILEVFQERFQSFAKEKKLGETLLLVAQHWRKKCVQRTMTRVLDTLEVVPLPLSATKIHTELVSAFSSVFLVDPGSDASFGRFVDVYIQRYLDSFSEHRNCSPYFASGTSRVSYETENKTVRFLGARVSMFLYKRCLLSEKLSDVDRFATMIVNPKEELDILSICSKYRAELSRAQFRDFEGAPALLKTVLAHESIRNYPLRTVQFLAGHIGNIEGVCRALQVPKIVLVVLVTTMEEVGQKCSWLTVEVKFITALLTRFPECRFFIERDLRCFQLKKDEIMCMSWSDFEVQLRALEDVVNRITLDNRKFFESFESDGSSVLYRHYHHQITTAALNEIGAIATAADAAVYINTMLSKIKGYMEAALEKPPVDEIIRISKALEDNDRKVDDEFKLLCNLILNQRDGQRVRSIVTEMNNVVKLFGLRQLLLSFALGWQGDGQAYDTPTLQRLGFTCVTGDDYREMVSAAELIADAELLGSWKAHECQQYLSTILTAFHLSDSPEELTVLRRLLHLFAKLGSASKLWEFFEENDSYIADDGRGYSRIFVDKVDDFLGELDGEDLKILENFKTVAGWTTTVMALTKCPFAEIMSILKVSPTIVAHLGSDVRGIPFKLIETVQKDMDFITTLFQVGLSSLDSVLGQLRSIQAASCYRFDLRTGQLTLEYYDDKRKTFITWKDDQLQDFEQRLGFVQQEPKAALMNIPAKLQEIRSMKASLDVLCQLHRRGHPKVVESVWAFPVGEQAPSVFPPFPRKLGASTTKLQQQLQDWDQKIEQAMIDNSLLRLFSVEQLQRIASHIKANHVRQLTLSIIHVIAHSLGSWNDLVTQVQGAARHCTNARSDSDWLAVACLFFQTMREFFKWQTFDAPSSTCATRIKCSTRQGDIIRLLCALFPNEPPLAHQLLWGHPAMTESTLCDFLRRASAFPSTRFVLIRSDALSPSNQQVLLRALLKDIHLQQNLSCIECSGSSNSLQAASWLSCAIAEDMCANVRENNILRKWIGQEAHDFTWIHGPPCSGKTHQLQKRIQQANTLIHLAVNEQMNWKDAIDKFQAVLQNESLKRIDVVIQIHFGFFRPSEHESLRELLRDVDIFLFNLLVLRSLQSSDLTLLVNIPPKMAVRVTMEVSDDVVCPVGGRGEMLPVMNHVSTFVDASQCEFEPDANAMHVSKYLKAYESGTIDSLYKDQGSAVEQIAFALDVSGSMSGSRLDICKNELRKIFASQIPPDSCVRFVAFESTIRVDVASAPWSPRHKQQVEYYLDSLSAGGGTSMWTALHNVITTIGATKKKAIVVALTDGEAGDESLAGTVKSALQSNPQIRILFIGVQLEPQYANIIRSHCIRSNEDELFLAGQSSDLSAAWTSVGERLTVSQQIEQAGESITPDECRRLLRKYMHLDSHHQRWTRLHQVFWIQYMYRRCGVLASSEKFNKNTHLKQFGSTTMAIMLEEVDRALENDFMVDWHSVRHEQMIYRKGIRFDDQGQQVEDYSWSLLATNPDDESDPVWKHRKELVGRLQMTIPTEQDLSRADRRVLDSYLAYGLGIPLNNLRNETSSSGRPFDFHLGSLQTLDEKKFVLTLDFVMKLLVINERVECGIPCIMEGETGVSKTALTQIYFHLKNGAKAPSKSMKALENTVRDLTKLKTDPTLQVLRTWTKMLSIFSDGELAKLPDDSRAWAVAVCSHPNLTMGKELLDHLAVDLSLNPLTHSMFQRFPLLEALTIPDRAADLLLWLVAELLRRRHEPHRSQWSFFPVNVHSAMTTAEFKEIVSDVSRIAQGIVNVGKAIESATHARAKLCIFFDEINTSSCMGLLKEIIIDRSCDGTPLPSNVVVLAACNPAREKLALYDNRKQEYGLDWVSGHYQVRPLPTSLALMKWDYGSLRPEQEREFISKRLRTVLTAETSNQYLVSTFADIIFHAHSITRQLAAEYSGDILKAKNANVSSEELSRRANSVVSLRDILRVFKLLEYLLQAPAAIKQCLFNTTSVQEDDEKLTILLLVVAVVYYFRMGVDQSHAHLNFRLKFCVLLIEYCRVRMDIENVVTTAMQNVISQTVIEPGIACTRGLQENVFMVLVTLIANVPLMIIGPPGSSKTLAVTIVMENARGEFSKPSIYQAVPALKGCSYQCSRRSTSREFQEVFERAIKRQAKCIEDGNRAQFFVFMDEAGLPEEGKESLKVLHYYLEDHTKVAAKVGLVAISNHILDAAKSNRCAILMRSKPDHDELMQITEGCLGGEAFIRQLQCTIAYQKPTDTLPVPLTIATVQDGKRNNLLDMVCRIFEACMHELPHPMFPHEQAPKEFIEFLGLRDYMHMIKLLKRITAQRKVVTLPLLRECLERNMNGADKRYTKAVIDFFCLGMHSSEKLSLRNPLGLMFTSIEEQSMSSSPTGRYILVLDTTTNDSILRLVFNRLHGKQPPRLLKLSEFVGDSDLHKVQLISQVRWSTDRGDLVLLSNSESINESFYDLFNQHFRKSEEHTKQGTHIVYHANIAVGAHSRRCKVESGFTCIVHLTMDELRVAPAPFLNRFEKYQVTLADVLQWELQQTPFLAQFKALPRCLGTVFHRVQALVRTIGRHAIVGFKKDQTLESAFLSVIQRWKSLDEVVEFIGGFATVTATSSTAAASAVTGSDNVLLPLQEHFMEAVKSDLGTEFPVAAEHDLRSYMLTELNRSDSEVSRPVQVMLGQALLHHVVSLLLDVAIPEAVLSVANHLPPLVIQHVLSPRKFQYHLEQECAPGSKSFVFTRTTPDIVRLQTASGEQYLSFSNFHRETDFLAALEQFFANRHRSLLVLIFDLSLVSTTQINFARYKVDATYAHDPETTRSKRVCFLLHATVADWLVQHPYDVTFHEDWSYRFVDGLHHDLFSLEWLRFALLPPTIETTSMEVETLLLSATAAWKDEAICEVAKYLTLDDQDASQVLRSMQEMLALTTTDRSTLYEHVSSRFVSVWTSAAPDNDPAALFRYEITQKITAYVTGMHSGPLGAFVVDESKHMFFKYLQLALKHIITDCSSLMALEKCLQLRLNDGTTLLTNFLEALPTVPLSALRSPVKPTVIARLPTSCCFPRFQAIFTFLEAASSTILDQYASYEEDDVWERMLDEVAAMPSVDPVASLVLVEHWTASEEVWQLYLNRYLKQVFPAIEIDSLPWRFIFNWFVSRVMEGYSGAMAQIHLSGKYYLDSLIFCSEVLNQSASYLDNADVTEIQSAVEAEDDSNLMSWLIEKAFQLLSSCNTWADVMAWSPMAMGLRVNSGSLRGIDVLKMKVMAVAKIMTSLPVQESHQPAAVTVLHDLIKGLSSKTLAWNAIWTTIEQNQELPNDWKLQFLLSMLHAAPSTELGPFPWTSLVSMVSTDNRHPELLAPVLDQALVATRMKSKMTTEDKDIAQWLETATDDALDPLLQIPDATYLPRWLRPSETTYSPLVDAMYQVVSRWVWHFHAQEEVSTLARLFTNIKDLNQGYYRHTKKLVLSSVFHLMMHHWAVAICDGAALTTDPAAIDCFLVALDVMKQPQAWSAELRRNLLTKVAGNEEALCTTVQGWVASGCAAGSQTLADRALLVCGTDLCAVVSQDIHFFEGHLSGNDVLQSWWKAQGSRLVPPAAYQWCTISNIDRWFSLIPLIFELYELLTDEIRGQPAISEETMKDLRFEEFVHRSVDVVGMANSTFLYLWAEIRAIIETSDSSMGRSFHESVTLWDLLSTQTPSEARNGRLYDVLVALLTMYRQVFPKALPPNVTTERIRQQGLKHLLETLPRVSHDDRVMQASTIAEVYDGCRAVVVKEHQQHVTVSEAKHAMWYTLIGRDGVLVTRLYQLALTASPALDVSLFPQRYCYFADRSNNLAASIATNSLSLLFHALDYFELKYVLRALDVVQVSMNNKGSTNHHNWSIREALLSYGHCTDLSSCVAFMGIDDADTSQQLLSLLLSDIPRLITFFQQRLTSEFYIFAGKPYDMKTAWSSEVEEALNTLATSKEGDTAHDLSDNARSLEALLAKHELFLSSRPNDDLVKRLAMQFKSEDDLLKAYPLLQDMTKVMEPLAGQHAIVCAHYVFLRLKLRVWGQMRPKRMTKRSWTWCLDASKDRSRGPAMTTLEMNHHQEALPWFLRVTDTTKTDAVAPDDELAEYNRHRERHASSIIRRFVRHLKRLKEQRREEMERRTTTADGAGRGGGRGGGRGRGGRHGRSTPMGRSGTNTGRGGRGILGSAVVELERKRTVKNRLQELCQLPLTHASAMECETLLVEAEALLIPSPELQPFVTALATFKERVATLKSELQHLQDRDTLDLKDLERILTDMAALGIHADPEYCSGETLLQHAKDSLSQQATLLATTGEQLFEESYCQDLMALHETMQRIKLPMHQELVARVQQRAKDIDKFETIAQEHLQEAHVDLCIHALRGELPASFYLTTLSAEAQDALNLLSFQPRTSLMKTNVDRAIQRLREAPLNTEPMGALLLAASYASPTHIARYRAYAIESLRRFCDTLVDGQGSWSPLVALVLSRLSNDMTGACARLCDPIAFTTLLSPQEKALLTPPPDAAATTGASSSPSLDTITGQYERIKANNNGQSWDALDAIMQLIGLRSMKEHVLRAVESMCNVQKVPVASRVPQTYHFALLGNPGTGKSTVAKHLATLLHQLQIRSSATVVETTGEKLAQMSPTDASTLFDSALGGTLVIDEAYALNPKQGQSSGAIAMNLLDLAESKRSEISIIIIGNKDDIEQNLFQFNSGFARRFPYQITFDDYTDNELGTIFGQLLQAYHWTAASPKVVEVAARRVGRGRGCKSFGNAGNVRVLFEAAYQRAVARPASSLVMEIEDILGPPPTPENIPALRSALHDLDSITGLDAVKQRIYQLVDQAAINYQLELDGKKPVLTPLNAVFLGNPGTGKTTVAKIYGRILKGLGLLTDGTCEVKGPSDFMGSYVGETAKKTSQLLQMCKGRVLIVDEAYGFHGSSFGKEAIDTLVGLVHNAPGEDIAVVFIGYRKEMETMFREQNPGLARRFSLQTAFVFEDFDDMQLEDIALHALQQAGGITAPLDVLLALVKSVTVQRLAPNFGNAGTMVTAVQQALQRMTTRDPTATTLTMIDVTGDQAVATDPLEYLSTLCKTEHIVQELRLLQAVIEQQRRDGVDTRGGLKNYLFLGNAGTGKTTVARTMANMLHALGLLSRNVVVTRTAQDLQGAYIGQTKDKVNAAMAEASGGVLFIDEAYTLGGSGHRSPFAQEAVDQLIALMTEPEHLGRTVVILAGYRQAMEDMIRHSNEGLRSRFTGRIEFPNWDADDCLRYIREACRKDRRPLEATAETLLQEALQVAVTHPSWSNARDCITMQKLLYNAFAVRNVQGRVTTNSYSIEDVHSAMDEWRRLRPAVVVVDSTASVLPIPPPVAIPVPMAVIPGPALPAPPTRDRDQAMVAPHQAVHSVGDTLPSEVEEVEEEEDIVEETPFPGTDDPALIALEIACQEAGYDDNHQRRKELIHMLQRVLDGGVFPDDVIDVAMRHMAPASRAETITSLRPQVRRVLTGVKQAVAAEEAHLREVERIRDEEERRVFVEKQARFQEQLRSMQLCPAGFTWRRCGDYWRCLGGSHCVSEAELEQMCL